MHTNNIYEDLNKIKAILTKTVDDAKHEATDVVFDRIDNLKERADIMKDNLKDYVRKKPFFTIGLSLVAGIILSRILQKK